MVTRGNISTQGQFGGNGSGHESARPSLERLELSSVLLGWHYLGSVVACTYLHNSQDLFRYLASCCEDCAWHSTANAIYWLRLEGLQSNYGVISCQIQLEASILSGTDAWTKIIEQEQIHRYGQRCRYGSTHLMHLSDHRTEPQTLGLAATHLSHLMSVSCPGLHLTSK